MGYYDPVPVSPVSPTDEQGQAWPLISRSLTDEVVHVPVPQKHAEPRPNFFLRRAQTFRSFFSRRRTRKVSISAGQSRNGEPTIFIKPVLKPAPKPAPKPAALKPALKPYRPVSTHSKRKSMGPGATTSRAAKRMTRVMSMNVQELAESLAAPPPPAPPLPSEHSYHNAHRHHSMYESFENYTFASNMKRASVMVVGSPSVMI